MHWLNLRRFFLLEQFITNACLVFDDCKWCGMCNVGNGRATLDDQEFHGSASVFALIL